MVCHDDDYDDDAFMSSKWSIELFSNFLEEKGLANGFMV